MTIVRRFQHWHWAEREGDSSVAAKPMSTSHQRRLAFVRCGDFCDDDSGRLEPERSRSQKVAQMFSSDAAQTLIHAVSDDAGTFTLLRLGDDPGEERYLELRQALRTLAREMADAAIIPREIAFACGVLLHFEEECLSSLQSRENSGPRTTIVAKYVRNLCQDAFNVLSGEVIGQS
jgi:hypothetical protein